jgi:adenosylcobyric acid synthase
VRVGPVAGTSWHGLLENDLFRRSVLADAAARAGRSLTAADKTDNTDNADNTDNTVCFADVRQRRLDVLGDLVADHLDTEAVFRLIEDGPPAGLPFIPPGAPR